MKIKMNNEKWLSNLKNLLRCFVFYIFFVCFFRIFTTEKITLSQDWGYVVSVSALFSSVCLLWQFQKKIFSVFSVITIFYLVAMFVKVFAGMILPEREIVHTLAFSTVLWSGLMFVAYPFNFVKNTFLKYFGKIALFLLYFLIILLPAAIVFYFISNRAVFSSDIFLALFQTNLKETTAYLSDQNKCFWLAGLLVAAALFGIAFYFFKNLFMTLKKNLYIFALVASLLFYVCFHIVPKMNIHFAFNIFYGTFQTLTNFKEYNDTRYLRLQKTAQLKNIIKSSGQGGIFVVALGESETKDHMSAYGYSLPTTPYLDKLAQQKNVILYSNAYSNHTHTIPTLTYALSSIDQYHKKELSDSYSIIDVAKAAGFETYWISNQPKDSVFLTPLSVMSSMADHQIWLNTSMGDKIFESYHDSRLIDELSALKGQEKAFVVLHLMGSHGAYRDRYPASFNRFKKNKGSHIDSYDNSILYSDFVLNGLYEKLKQHPHFMAFVYFSDHGDDPDHKLGHESSRFTFEMARIPFVMAFSDRFIDQNKALFETLSKHKENVWTNDLFYDVMLSLLGVSNVYQDPLYNLADPSYALTEDEALTLHGAKKIKEDF